MSSATNLASYRSKPLLNLIDQIRAEAEHGEINGIVFCVHRGAKDHVMGLGGSYRDDPWMALTAIVLMESRMTERLRQYQTTQPDREIRTAY